MPGPPQDQPRAAERILAAAAELFYREGARAVGVDEIVVRARATKPSLYRAFGSKDRLIAASSKAKRRISGAFSRRRSHAIRTIQRRRSLRSSTA